MYGLVQAFNENNKKATKKVSEKKQKVEIRWEIDELEWIDRIEDFDAFMSD